jgi:histidinol-phosphate aminotransferase
MTLEPRPALDSLDAYAPGQSLARMAAELGLERITNLATNETTFGPFPAAIEALRSHASEAHRYPELDGELIERIAAAHGVPSAQVALGNGADSLIGYLCTAYLEPGTEVVVGAPSFPTYHLDAIKMGAIPVVTALRDGSFDTEALAEAVSDATRIVFVCNPNNPTGGIVTAAELRGLIDAVPSRVLVVVDEAYAEYVSDPAYPETIAEYLSERDNVVVLRTFSKIFGLAGLRVGYLIGPAAVVDAVGRVRHYYDINSLAEIAALASLDHPGEVERRRAATAALRLELAANLERRGLHPFPAHGNFVAFERPDAADIEAALLRVGIVIRTAGSLVRITIGSADDHRRLLAALDSE